MGLLDRRRDRGSIVLQIVLLELEQHAIVRLQAKLALANASRMLWHVLHLPMTFFAQRSPAEVSNRVAICDRVAELLSSRLAASAIGVVAALFYLALMAHYDRFLAAVSLAIAGLNILALRIVARFRSDANAALLQEEAMLLGSSVSGLERIETLKSGGAESTFFMKWLGRQARVINARQRFAVPSQVLNAVPRLLITINVTAILTLGGLRVIEGAISIGTLFAYTMLMQLFITPFTTFVELGADVQEMDGDLRRIQDVMRYPMDQRRVIERVDRTRLAGELELRGVSFGYNKHGVPAIRDISFVIAPGRRVALVGPSGSGKSTIAKLVSGLFEPWSGSVLFDGIEREAIDPALLGTDVAFVDQEISLYPGTIRSNLTLWDPAVNDASVERAARDACIHADIVGRPEGYEAAMAEGGINFSGGQRQRLEIARALVRDPALVVLDEATSALDPLTEYLIDESLRRRGCACLSWRTGSARSATPTRSWFSMAACIAERGTHDELVAHERPLPLAGEVAMIADREVRISGDEVLVLSQKEHAYRVRSGEAALFVVELDADGHAIGRRSFLGAAGPGISCSARRASRRARRSRSLPLASFRRSWSPGTWPSEPAVRDEALSRYIATLVGNDSIELDVQMARPVATRETVALAPGEHAHSSRKLTYVRIRSGKGGS